ncbi:MAG: helix-turn-helix domain-containing protein [Clostridiales bacterium]|nr:helix-turn-helix domain-containing protein [Clostridiales bacterium]
MKSMSEILRELRTSKSMTQSDVAKILGLTTNAYQSYERGTSEPGCKALNKLADFYGVTTDYLLGRETGEPEPIDVLASRFNMTALEKEILDNYLALPKDTRGDMMEFLQKSVKKVMEKSESVQSNAQSQSEKIQRNDTYGFSEQAIARSSESNYKPAPTEEQYNEFIDLPDDMLGE